MRNSRVELADGEYEIEKALARARGAATCVTIRMIERRNKLKAGQLLSYRANHYSRKAPSVPEGVSSDATSVSSPKSGSVSGRSQ
jgi:hypothetical protein